MQRSWLDGLFANRIPKTNRTNWVVPYAVAKRRCAFGIHRISGRCPEKFYLVSAGAMERHDYDTLQKTLNGQNASLEKVTTQYGVLVLAGPKSRDLLQKLTDCDLSNEKFPWLTGQFINVGCAQARALRVNFVGELGWELHHPIEMQNYIYDLLFEAGAEFDLRPFGIRAMDSLRIEKSYRLIPRELSIEYSAFESGLDRFVKTKGREFIGREALLAWQKKGFANAFVTLEVGDVTHSDARGNEPVYHEGELVGRCTSGNFGWRLQKSLALGMVPPALAKEGTSFEVEILGDRYPATVIPESPYDPENARLRS